MGITNTKRTAARGWPLAGLASYFRSHQRGPARPKYQVSTSSDSEPAKLYHAYGKADRSSFAKEGYARDDSSGGHAKCSIRPVTPPPPHLPDAPSDWQATAGDLRLRLRQADGREHLVCVERSRCRAAGSYFQAMLGNVFKEADADEIVLEDTPIEAAQMALAFAHGRPIALTIENVVPVFEVAQKWDMPSLMALCRTRIEAVTEPPIFAQLLRAALQTPGLDELAQHIHAVACVRAVSVSESEDPAIRKWLASQTTTPPTAMTLVQSYTSARILHRYHLDVRWYEPNVLPVVRSGASAPFGVGPMQGHIARLATVPIPNESQTVAYELRLEAASLPVTPENTQIRKGSMTQDNCIVARYRLDGGTVLAQQAAAYAWSPGLNSLIPDARAPAFCRADEDITKTPDEAPGGVRTVWSRPYPPTQDVSGIRLPLKKMSLEGLRLSANAGMLRTDFGQHFRLEAMVDICTPDVEKNDLLEGLSLYSVRR